MERAYAEIATERPEDAQANYRLALARLRLGRLEPAADGFQSGRNTRLAGSPDGVPPGVRVQCRLGRAPAALDQLDRAVAAGFSQVKLLEGEEDLRPLRELPRFQATLKGADRNLRPCVYDKEHEQFDFWLGEWDVRPAGAPATAPPASSVITKILDGCVVLESWSGQIRGQSFNIFDATERKWHQTWVDTTGGLHEYWGAREAETMAFVGQVAESPGQAGIPTRMTFFRLGPDSVRQFSESSHDGGKTWTPNYDLIYTRRQPAAK